MKDVNEDVQEILKLYGNSMNDKKKFYHILEQIGKHIIKLTKLKENEDRPGHFNEEVADMYILAKALFELEKIDDNTLDSASKHFVEKIKEIYG
ncbi:MAG: hypothetical protein U9R08_01745 [Nanoarchaeota archaeon]|nr:hypothetical protein [Nanoarchaeota archaeon]